MPQQLLPSSALTSEAIAATEAPLTQSHRAAQTEELCKAEEHKRNLRNMAIRIQIAGQIPMIVLAFLLARTSFLGKPWVFAILGLQTLWLLTQIFIAILSRRKWKTSTELDTLLLQQQDLKYLPILIERSSDHNTPPNKEYAEWREQSLPVLTQALLRYPSADTVSLDSRHIYQLITEWTALADRLKRSEVALSESETEFALAIAKVLEYEVARDPSLATSEELQAALQALSEAVTPASPLLLREPKRQRIQQALADLKLRMQVVRSTVAP